MMSHVDCKRCGASVPETKAFCPECGGALVDEQVRQHASEHDSYDATVNLSKSGYNLMLSEMNLNISDAPNLTAERINLSREFRSSLVLDPVEEKTSPRSKIWLITAVAALLLLLLVALGLLAAFFLLR